MIESEVPGIYVHSIKIGTDFIEVCDHYSLVYVLFVCMCKIWNSYTYNCTTLNYFPSYVDVICSLIASAPSSSENKTVHSCKLLQ